jgi:hypothetical protein
MLIGRTIVAVILAVAVALLPASGGSVFATQIAAQQQEPAVAASAAHDADQAVPCDQGRTVDDCASLSVCALKCFGYTGTRLPNLTASFAAIRLGRALTADKVNSRGGIPPFRPPRA